MQLFDLIRIQASQITPDNTKIHLAAHNGSEHPISVFRDGKFKEWQEWQSKKNFERPYLLSLIPIPGTQDRWLFAGCYHVLGCQPHPQHADRWLYQTTELAETAELAGRLIVGHTRSGRATVRLAETINDQLSIIELREKRISTVVFTTYSEVRLSKKQLNQIVAQNEPSWSSALSSVKGIYLITDTSNGKLYVGSATGKTARESIGGIWSRWTQYSQDGHGGNVELRNIIDTNGIHYADEHFQYSILEIADTHASDDEILDRESHWKKVLHSKAPFGYNLN